MEQIRNIPKEIADQYQDFFDMMNQEHDLILTISEMDEIILEAIKVKSSFDKDAEQLKSGSSVEPTVEYLDEIYENCDEPTIQGNQFYLRGFEDRGNYQAKNRDEEIEITDEEIWEASSDTCLAFNSQKAFNSGAKWYRNQLKKKN